MTPEIFEIIGKFALCILAVKIIWTIWYWILSVNTERGYCRRSWDKIYKRVTDLEDAENERKRKQSSR